MNELRKRCVQENPNACALGVLDVQARLARREIKQLGKSLPAFVEVPEQRCTTTISTKTAGVYCSVMQEFST